MLERVLCLVQPVRMKYNCVIKQPGLPLEKKTCLITMPYLVKSVDFFSISSESHESSVQINKTTNDKVLLTDSCLLRVAELSTPHHVAVAALDAEDRTVQQQNSFSFVTFNKKDKSCFFFCLKVKTYLSWMFPLSSPTVTVTFLTLFMSKCRSYWW